MQSEIATLKGDFTDLQVNIKSKSLEGDIRQSTKSLLESDSRTRKTLSDLVSFISVLEKCLKIYGDVEYEELGRILNSLKFYCIYVKGEQKKQLLMEHIPHIALVNIEDLGCPRLDQICGDKTLPC
ncbi:Uncharacterized protein FWK35_00030107, partial [Aphis craccivora]